MPQGPFEQERRSLLRDGLRSATRVVSQRPQITLWIVVVLACGCIGLTLTSIEFKTDRADLIDPDAAFHQRWLAYTENFSDSSDIVVVVEADDRDAIARVLDELGRRMEREPRFFRSVLYRVDAGRVPSHKGLQYLPPEQLEGGLRTLDDLRPYYRNGANGLSLDAVFASLSAELDAATKQPGASRTPGVLNRADRLAASLSAYLADPDRFESPWPVVLERRGASLAAADAGPSYFLNASGTMGFLKAFPASEADNFDGATQSIDRLRVLIDETKAKHAGVRIGVTGIPVLENDEMRRSRADMSKAALLSFVGVGLILMVGFRGLRHPLLALTMLAVGVACSFGYTTVMVGHLNILSISFAVILIGLGIDFAIHYLARYLELRHCGDELQPALLRTSAGVGAGVVTAAVTTAFAFFCATFTEFRGVAELGIIAGGGILLCAAATFLVLPALISLADRNVEPKRLPSPFQGDLLRRATSAFPRPVAFLSLVIVVGVGSQVLRYKDEKFKLRVKYDYNLLNLQADGLESVETQKRVFKNADHSLLYAVSIAETPAEARKLKKRFESLPSVDHVEELASTLPAVPHKQTRLLVQAYRSLLAGIGDSPPKPPAKQPQQLGLAIEQFYLRVRRLRDPTARHTAAIIDRFLDRFEQLSLRDQAALFGGYQRRAAAALHSQLAALAAAANPEPVTIADLPKPLTSRFVGRDGKLLLQVYPKQQIWDVEPLQRFVADVRSVDPEVTGTPLQNLEASRQIKSSYKTASLYALAVILLVLLVDFLDREYTLLTLLFPLAVILFTMMAMKTRGLHLDPLVLVMIYAGMAVAIAAIFDFRNLRDALLAMIPPIAGGVIMFGVLGMLGVDLNPANLIVLPLVLGIGVDDGVHVVHDFRLQRGRYRTSASTMNAIVLTSLTSMAGFGSMMVAAHRGLYTVGLVLVVGVGSCLFVSLVTLPAILTLVSGDRETREDSSQPHLGPVARAA
ncbi:MAG: MMPL family transporter [Planctomycetaceae bacterium]